ncbi:MAG: LuxR C-terminal-related transcriptional regulator, partial [Acidimicrobiia bacterium]|nr:LuxR C-terminal-related transcriptional regulator [Acidimicrobiia bacterium]
DDDLAPLLAVRPGPSADPETDQHWMLQSVSTLLTRIAEQRPVLLIIEDVHLAGRPTRTLLRHLVDTSRPSGLLMVVTFRDAPSDLDGEGGALIEGIGQASTARRRALEPLDRDEVAEMVRATADVPLGEIEAKADLLYGRTGGNPLLTIELWLHLRRSTTDREPSSAVPASIIELATRQLHDLPPASRSVVELGATMGPDIDLELLAAVLDCDIDEIVSRAMPAVQARLLIEDRPGRLRFVHSLIADSVVYSLPLDTRMRHHRSFVGAIDQQAEPELMLVAHHALSAVPLVPAEEALRRSEVAAEAAMQSVAFGDAITVLERALDLNVSGSRRAELLLALARASAIGGDASRCVEACGEAAAVAREHGDRSLLREAAFVAGESIWTRTPTTTAGAISLLEEAVAATATPRERTRLLAALTSISALAGNAVRSVECGEEALRLAREVGEPALLLDALHRNMFRELRPENAEAHLELTGEAVRLADQVGDDRLTLRILAKTLLALTVVCEPEWLARELERFDRLAHRLREPLYLMTNEGFRTMLAVSEGRLQEAEAIAEDADRTWTNQTGYGLQMFAIRREQDRIAELRPVLEVAGGIQGATGPRAWGPGLAVVYAEVGMVSEAQSLLTDLVNDDLAMVARDSLFPGVLSYLSDVATAVGDQGAAARIHDHLVPYEGMLVTFPGVVSHGSADRYLGRLCETMGRVRAAREHFERAVDVDERLGWTTWAAHSRYELGRHLVEKGKQSDSSAGFAHLRRAHRMARSGRLVALARRCQSQLGGSGEDRGSNLLTRRELDVLEALAEGRTNREIGERIHASRHTVANHVRAILAKTGTANRTEAARWAYQRGLVRTDGVPAVE